MIADPEILRAQIARLDPLRPAGRVAGAGGGTVRVSGLTDHACLGARVRIYRSVGLPVEGEIVRIGLRELSVLTDGPAGGIRTGDAVALIADQADIAPCDAWIGRIVDPFGRGLDGAPLMQGAVPRPVFAAPPPAAGRAALGARLGTGLAVFDTFLPIVRGQRIGLFAGSGVGKSRLLADLARGLEADLVVIAMIGERGRELRHFAEQVLGPGGMKRAVIVAATSDQPALTRRRCAAAAMTVAEHFRDAGRDVLLLADSVTRFAEAHREIATAAGESPALRGFPPSVAGQIMALCERAGPGCAGQGAITGVFSVLVAGSDMDEPVADTLRGVLDGHVVLDREIAERGRFPAIDVLKSVSRSLPEAASLDENALLSEARRLLGAYERARLMIEAGLHAEGADPTVDAALRVRDDLDRFIGKSGMASVQDSFNALRLILRRARAPAR